MDNDNKITKAIKKTIKDCKFKWDYRDIDILSEKDGNALIAQMIDSTSPVLVARGGATEMRCIGDYLSSGRFSEKISQEISTLSGVFPANDCVLERFCNTYIDAIGKADLISLWGVGAEAQVVHKYCLESKFTELHALEPYYFDNPWSRTLKGKELLIVHPFVDSIIRQYEKRELLWKNKEVLPEVKKLYCVKAVQSIAGQRTEFKTWFDALQSMKNKISEIDFDVAIIGAGAYGLPLAAYCKSLGRKAIQMSGATQILFGIKGKRWDNHPVISMFYNDEWIRPSAQETPQQLQKVEGGSYW